jgi:hypothetical protein
MRVYLEGIGLCGPGLDGWESSLPILAGVQDYSHAPTRVPVSTLLPPNERRRAVQTVKIALAVGTEAFTASGRDPAETASIFTSSGGDGDTIDDIMSVLASANRELSPTRFHNSVHNAPSGYWGIANAARAPSSSLCCHDGSFAAGFLEAAVQAVTEDRPVALIAYDVCYPAPLSLVRPIAAAFGVALVLSPEFFDSAIACIELRLSADAAESEMALPALETLRKTIPAARGLPLLALLARQTAAEVTLEYLDDLALSLDVTPLHAESRA